MLRYSCDGCSQLRVYAHLLYRLYDLAMGRPSFFGILHRLHDLPDIEVDRARGSPAVQLCTAILCHSNYDHHARSVDVERDA